MCSSDSQVLDSRPTAHQVKRRRRCLKCGYLWITFETSGETEAKRRAIIADAKRRLDKLYKLLGKLNDWST
jgi:transcriptional regulator NrdR family protein